LSNSSGWGKIFVQVLTIAPLKLEVGWWSNILIGAFHVIVDIVYC